jgi:hypothetical protein
VELDQRVKCLRLGIGLLQDLTEHGFRKGQERLLRMSDDLIDMEGGGAQARCEQVKPQIFTLCEPEGLLRCVLALRKLVKGVLEKIEHIVC